MKNIYKLILFAVVLLATQAGLYAQQKYGHVNTTEIFQVMPDVKAANDGYQAYAKVKQSEMEQMNAEYLKKMTEYQDKQKSRSESNKITVDAELQAMASSITDLQQRIQAAQQRSQQDMQNKEEELYSPIQRKVDNAIKIVAKEKGYTYIFDVAAGGLKYYAEADDLTPAVRLNLGISPDAKPITPAGSPDGATNVPASPASTTAPATTPKTTTPPATTKKKK
ncbi:periplasmic chaperone for outer membrane proteins Skp [bacterium A37T11]|nr:periplasmic chaperone for outer membrane proteins Skp [bacterium A37T11]